jgi:hypothetical protein
MQINRKMTFFTSSPPSGHRPTIAVHELKITKPAGDHKLFPERACARRRT